MWLAVLYKLSHRVLSVTEEFQHKKKMLRKKIAIISFMIATFEVFASFQIFAQANQPPKFLWTFDTKG